MTRRTGASGVALRDQVWGAPVGGPEKAVEEGVRGGVVAGVLVGGYGRGGGVETWCRGKARKSWKRWCVKVAAEGPEMV